MIVTMTTTMPRAYTNGARLNRYQEATATRLLKSKSFAMTVLKKSILLIIVGWSQKTKSLQVNQKSNSCIKRVWKIMNFISKIIKHNKDDLKEYNDLWCYVIPK